MRHPCGDRFGIGHVQRGLGVEPDGRASEAFSVFQHAEIAKWGKVIQDAGIQAE